METLVYIFHERIPKKSSLIVPMANYGQTISIVWGRRGDENTISVASTRVPTIFSLTMSPGDIFVFYHVESTPGPRLLPALRTDSTVGLNWAQIDIHQGSTEQEDG